MPEQLFIEYTNGVPSEVAVTLDATTDAFLKDGVALTAAEQELADMSIIIWKAQFGRLTPRYAHDDGGKIAEERAGNGAPGLRPSRTAHSSTSRCASWQTSSTIDLAPVP